MSQRWEDIVGSIPAFNLVPVQIMIIVCKISLLSADLHATTSSFAKLVWHVMVVSTLQALHSAQGPVSPQSLMSFLVPTALIANVQ